MFRLTRKELWAHKLRSALTGLAVVLGVAFMAGTMVLTDTMEKTFDGVIATANDGTDVIVRQEAAIDGDFTGARERIDALDDRIIGLIQERMAVSAVIQDARIASGGRRVNLSREMEILGHYSEALGKPGTSLAMTLLELCRGRI